ncbi:MAG: carboxypeptidase-like regulatory domain-containing protein [Planctomycetota bacterium]
MNLAIFRSVYQDRGPALRRWLGQAGTDGRFRIEGLRQESYYSVNITSPEQPALAFKIHADADQDLMDLGDLKLRPDSNVRSVRLKVVDEGGTAIAGARIGTWRYSEDARFTDAAGHADVPVAHDLTILPIDRPGFLHTEVVPGARAELEVTLRRAPLVRGRVVDDSGAPVPFAMVRLLPTAENYEPRPNEPLPRTWCDAEGRFELHQAHPGKSYVQAEAPGFVELFPFPIVAEGGEIVAKLARDPWLVVELIAAEVAQEWTIGANSYFDTGRRLPRNERIVWMLVHPGRCNYTVEVPGYSPVTGSLELFPGETRRVQVTPTQ